MAKAKFDRSKPHCNVGTIGHVDHGKTTLTAALTKVSADRGWTKESVSYDQVAKASESQGRRDPTKILTIATSHVEYSTWEVAIVRILVGSRRPWLSEAFATWS
jgi:elongation factor Tu